MQARKGEWFSLTWDITDFHHHDSYTQFESAPKFLYAEKDSNQIESEKIKWLLTNEIILNSFVSINDEIIVSSSSKLSCQTSLIWDSF